MSRNSEDFFRVNVDFVPDKIFVGKFENELNSGTSLQDESENEVDAGFVTCRYKNASWISPSIFERLCGFKPCVQRDSEKELNKILKNAVLDFDNVPTSGFKVMDLSNNFYSYSGREYSYAGDVVLEDPRGFCVAIDVDNFAQMLVDCKGNMKDGVLDESVKFVYAFGDRAYLIPSESKLCKKILVQQSKAKDEKGQLTYVKPSKFEVGHAYRTSDVFSYSDALPGIYIYIGQFKTFSEEYIKSALESGKNPDIDGIINYEREYKSSYNWNSNFKTQNDAKVFYLVEWDDKKAGKSELESYRFVNIGAKNLSKKFSKEVKINPTWTLSDGRPLSIESIRKDMAKMPMYSRLSDETLKKFKRMNAEDIKAMPFRTFCAAISSKDYRTPDDKNVDFPMTSMPLRFAGYSNAMNNIPSLIYNGMLCVSDDRDRYPQNGAMFKLADIAGKTIKELADMPISSTLSTTRADESSWNRSYVPIVKGMATSKATALQAYFFLRPYIINNAKFENGEDVPDQFFLLSTELWKDYAKIPGNSVYVSRDHLKQWKETCEDYIKTTREYEEYLT